MKKTLILVATLVLLLSQFTNGQAKFPELINADIPGAPILGKPMLIMGSSGPVKAEKHGLSAPLLYDWNKDGKKDLLIGEFESSDTGSTVRVYFNTGTNEHPKFTDKFEYAKATNQVNMYVRQWCCIGFTPQLIDLDQDGYPDIITGQYFPGEVTWFRGSKDGFLPGVKLLQEGNPIDHEEQNFIYWPYSSATFGDIDGDGLSDLITGGIALRWSKNIGTKKNPRFGIRRLLLDVNGEPLNVIQYNHQDSLTIKHKDNRPAGDSHISMIAVDWDQDGILDLLVTNSYRNDRLPFVSFFRGVKTPSGLRFEKGISLITAKDGQKAFPGSGPRVSVGDWNNDGVPDLIIGASVPTINNIFNDHLAWTYEDVTGIEAAGKDAGEVPFKQRQAIIEKIKADTGFRNYYLGKEGKIEYLDVRHQGYVYVMLGTKNPRRAVPVNQSAIKPVADTTIATESTGGDIVNYTVSYPKSIKNGDSFQIRVKFRVDEGWHIYAPTDINNQQGMKPTTITFKRMNGLELIGPVSMPTPKVIGLTEVFEGNDIEISQDCMVLGRQGVLKIPMSISYQTCNKDRCLPPKTDTVTLEILVR